MSIRVQAVYKSFDHGTDVLKDIEFEAGEGEMIAFLGPSGSGKTTLLRIIAGLDTPTGGEVYVRGHRVDQIPVHKRGIGVVFQNYALFKHMTVFDNIAFGLRVQRLSRSEIRERVTELLNLVKLTGLEHRYPTQLSGGQAQRVALARALAPNPSILLLDEPFSAIDANVRKELRHWVRELHEQIGITGIFVTHDQEEAFEVADRILVMNHGCVEQYGTPQEVFNQPATRFVAKFVGDATEYRAVREEGRVLAGPLKLPILPELSSLHDTGIITVRPIDVRFYPSTQTHHGVARVERRTFRGDHEFIDLSFSPGVGLRAHVPIGSEQDIQIGQMVSVEVVRYTWFEESAG